MTTDSVKKYRPVHLANPVGDPGYVSDAAEHPGEDPLIDATITIAGWKKARITGTGNVAGIGAGNVFGGMILQVAGTTTTLAAYDGDDATDATELIVPTTGTLATAGTFVSPFGGGVSPMTVSPPVGAGVMLTVGLHVVVGGTGSPSVWVLYR